MRARGCGYALEAARAMLALAADSFGFERIVALTTPGNDGSIRILESLRLRFDRVVRFGARDAESRLYVLDWTRGATDNAPP